MPLVLSDAIDQVCGFAARTSARSIFYSLLTRATQTQLLNGSKREQRVTAERLKQLALQDANRAAIADAGAIEPLIELLCSEDLEVQEEAAAALRSLALGQGAIRRRIVRAGSLPPLLAMLQLGSEDAASSGPSSAQLQRVRQMQRVRQRQEQAAGLLKTLAMHGESAAAIVAADGIPPLVALLESGDVGVQQDAAAALRNLAATCDASPAAIEQARGVGTLVGLLSSGNAEVQAAATGALRSLARYTNLHAPLIEAGALTQLQVRT